MQVLDDVTGGDEAAEREKRDKRIEILCIKLRLNSKTLTSDKLRYLLSLYASHVKLVP
jgi:hypothetical protein